MVEKKSLREEVGGAINAGSLRGKPTTLLNAFAAGSTRLGGVLWRLRYGGDMRQSTRKEAVVLLAHIIHANPKRIPGARLVLVVEQAMNEWLDDACPTCHGRQYVGSEFGDVVSSRATCPSCHGVKSAPPGKEARTFNEFFTPQDRMANRVSCQLCGGRGWRPETQVDATKTQVCRTCDGTGTRYKSPGARAVAVGLTTEAFEKQGWRAKYDRALDIMRAVDSRTGRTVQAAMRSLDGAPGLPFVDPGEVDAWMEAHGRR